MNVKDRIKHQFPEFITNEYPKLIRFVEHYYEFLESSEIVFSNLFDHSDMEVFDSVRQVGCEAGGGVWDPTTKTCSLTNFVVGETLISSETKVTSTVRAIDYANSRIFISAQYKFEDGETILGLTSGATGVIVSMTPNPIQTIEQLLDYKDIDKTINRYFGNFRNEFMASIPNKLASGVSKRFIIKNITDLYRTKGTSEGHRLFFKMLLDEDAEVYYPSEDLIEVSDGDWSFDTVMRVKKNVVQPNLPIGETIGNVLTLVGAMILQKNNEFTNNINQATCAVDSVKTFFMGATEVLEFSINKDSIIGEFVPAETIFITGDDNIEYQFELTPILSQINIVDPGQHYSDYDKVIIDGFGYPALAVIGSTTKGYITDIDIINGGDGYMSTNDPNWPVNIVFNETNTLGQGTDAVLSGINGAIVFEDGSGELEQEGYNVWITGIPESKILLNDYKESNPPTLNQMDVVDTRITRLGFNYNRIPTLSAYTAGTPAVLYPASKDVGGIGEVTIVDPGFDVTGAITPIPPIVLQIKNNTGNYVINDIVTSSSGGSAKILSWASDILILKIYQTTGSFLVDDVITGSVSGVTGEVLRNTTAVLSTETAVLHKTPGRFISENGFISAFAKRIQDNYYYQNFSYLVKVATSIVNWRSAVKKAMHPAGFNAFGEINIVSHLDLKLKIPTLGTTTFTPELFSTFKDIFHTTLRRRLGADGYGTKNPNPEVGVSGVEPDQPLDYPRNNNTDGLYDVEMTHEYLINWIHPTEHFLHWSVGGIGGFPETGPTRYNLNKFKFIDPPTLFRADYYYITENIDGSWVTAYQTDYGGIAGGAEYHLHGKDYGTITEDLSTTGTDHNLVDALYYMFLEDESGALITEDNFNLILDSNPHITKTHDYPGIHRTTMDNFGIGTHILTDEYWIHPDIADVRGTESIGTPSGYTIDQWGSFRPEDILKNKKHNVPPPSEITLELFNWLTFTSPPGDTSDLMFFRMPMNSTYNNRNYTSSGSATYTVTAGQSYIVHVDGLIHPSSEYSINNTTLTFSTPPSSGDIIEIREISSLVNERVYSGSGSTYTITPNKAVLVYINNVIQERIVDYIISNTILTTTSTLSGTDTIMILEIDDDMNTKAGSGDGYTTNFSIDYHADVTNSLVYVSGVYQMPTTNYTVL